MRVKDSLDGTGVYVPRQRGIQHAVPNILIIPTMHGFFIFLF